jgi:AraC-like DNA-binding protein
MAFVHLRASTLTRSRVAHEHAYHQLILATSGVTELSIEHTGERITAERGCLIPSTYHHEYIGDGNNRTLVLDLPLASIAAFGCGDELDRLFSRPCFYSVSTQLHDLAHGLMKQVEKTPHLQSDIACLLLRALYHQLYNDDAITTSRDMAHRLKGRDRIDMTRIDQFIDVHLAHPITVDALAELCALSPGHFHSCFRQVCRQTPLHYVQQRRLAHARSLILDTHLPLASVADLVGFRDQGSLSRAFRRQFGLSPSQARAC